MRTVGEILKAAREKKGANFLEAEKATKIRTGFLKLLEEDSFDQIPGGAIVAKGFIKNYGEFLGLSPRELLATFRRDFVENQKGQVLPRGYYKPLDLPGFSWTPRLTVLALVSLLILGLVAYLGFHVFSFRGKPPLILLSPGEEEKFTTPEVKISGKTDPDAQVLVNGELTMVSQDGYFEARITLLPGENVLTVEAVSRRGKKTRLVRKVFYQGPSRY